MCASHFAHVPHLVGRIVHAFLQKLIFDLGHSGTLDHLMLGKLMSPLLGSGEGLLLSLWSSKSLFDCKRAAKRFITLLLLVYSVTIFCPCICGSVKIVLIGRV